MGPHWKSSPRWWWLSVLLPLALSAPSVVHASFTPIFTKTYVRTTSTPDTVTDAFTACDPRGTFRITVVNGAGGQPRLSSASISVNGLEVVSQSEFNDQVSQIQKPLTNVGTNNTLAVRLTAKPSGAMQLTVEGDQSCGIRITSPAPGSVLTDSIVLVTGTVPSGGTVGVSVNGLPGFVEGNRWAALVLVDATVTSLTATARDFSGVLSTDSVAVTIQSPAERPLTLRATPPGGLAPLTVGFELTSLVGATQIALDADGNGTLDFTGTSLAGQTFTFTAPGIYTPAVRVTDASGRVLTTSTVVQVADRTALDLRLQAIWQGLRDALRAGDVARAASFIHGDTRDAYRAQFASFSAATLANIDQFLTPIQLVGVGFAGAQYEMLRLRNGQQLSFAVWFQLDADGLWRLRRF